MPVSSFWVFMSVKDPQYLTQALTNVLLMETVVRCLQPQKSIIAASQLANFDKIIHEGLEFHLMLLLLLG